MRHITMLAIRRCLWIGAMAACWTLSAESSLAQQNHSEARWGEDHGSDPMVSAEAPLRFVAKDWPEVTVQGDVRVMDSSRTGGPMGQSLRLYVLVPRQMAVTTQAQPSLFWYLSESTPHPVRVSVNAENQDEPALVFELDGKTVRGIQRVDLSRWSVTLQPGVAYEWSVAVLEMPQSPSRNLFAKSWVWRLDPSSQPAVPLPAADDRQKAAHAAEQGIWIDALGYLSDLIDHRPADPSLRRDRADLLRHADFDVTIQAVDNRFTENITTIQRSSPPRGGHQ